MLTQIQAIITAFDLKIKLVDSDEELWVASHLLHELRGHLSHDEVFRRIKSQMHNNYDLVIALKEGKGVGTMGFRIASNLAIGRYIYIDDLMVSNEYQGSGVGESMINWIKEFATDHTCNQIQLDSDITCHKDHEFFFRNDFKATRHLFVHTIL